MRQREAPSDGETTDVARVAEQVIEVNRTHLANKPVEVVLDVEEPLEVVAPSSVVAVALTNLVGNAFKYTPAGEVRVRIGDGEVVVEDSGPGIKLEDAERLFQRGGDRFLPAGAQSDHRTTATTTGELRTECAVCARNVDQLFELQRRDLQRVQIPLAEIHELAELRKISFP